MGTWRSATRSWLNSSASPKPDESVFRTSGDVDLSPQSGPKRALNRSLHRRRHRCAMRDTTPGWFLSGVRTVELSGRPCRVRPGPTNQAPLGRRTVNIARHRHVAAHHARELAGDGKAEPGTAKVLTGRSVSLAELLEQLGLLLRRHANAGVGDGELDEAAAIAYLACRKLDLARFGELARIAQKIEQDLPQS